jgi:Flp pilus assembly protein TadD
MPSRRRGARHLRGIIAFRTGDPATALAHIERAAALASQKADIRNSLGFASRAIRALEWRPMPIK